RGVENSLSRVSIVRGTRRNAIPGELTLRRCITKLTRGCQDARRHEAGLTQQRAANVDAPLRHGASRLTTKGARADDQEEKTCNAKPMHRLSVQPGARAQKAAAMAS